MTALQLQEAGNRAALELTAPDSAVPGSEAEDYLSATVCGEWFGIPVEMIRDILRPLPLTPVPLAPKQILGVMNLRGRVVTAVDVRCCLGLPPRENGARFMSVVIDHGGHFYSLIVDDVGEVLSCSARELESNVTVDVAWRSVSRGVLELEDRLIIVLDVVRLLETER